MTPEGQLEMSWKREAGVAEIVTKGLECYAKNSGKIFGDFSQRINRIRFAIQKYPVDEIVMDTLKKTELGTGKPFQRLLQKRRDVDASVKAVGMKLEYMYIRN